jgi:hypothetical protein
MRVVFESGPWYGGRHDIIVRDGRLISDQISIVYCSMTNNGCDLPWGGEFTVLGLFNTVHSSLSGERRQWVRARFNWYYGYPQHITVDDPAVFDEDMTWRVESFEPEP